jgi:hypothetical protein
MCDTLYKKIGDDAVFLKNSDRGANEPNLVVFQSARKAAEKLRCTYIDIDDADAFATLLYKPSWIWGAEMGVNEKGVSIGNEAVWTKSRGKRTERLLGMDLLRLGLERGACAKQALEVIISLLEEYGQGGNSGFDHSFYYDNSFLIADKDEAYVLETAGKFWAWKKVENQANISNRLSIEAEYDQSSVSGSFKKQHFEPVFSFFSGSANRMHDGGCSLSALKDISPASALAALRTHEHGADDKKLFNKGSVKSVCMHAGGVGDQTTGSMAVFYIGGEAYIWVTGSSTPCLSVFKPVVFGATEPVFADVFSAYGFWLEREQVNRAIYAGLIDADKHRAEVSQLENSFIKEFDGFLAESQAAKEKGGTMLGGGSVTDKSEAYSAFCLECARKEQKFYKQYAQAVAELKNGQGNLAPYWVKKSEKLGKNVFERQLCKRI